MREGGGQAGVRLVTLYNSTVCSTQTKPVNRLWHAPRRAAALVSAALLI